MAPGVAWPGGFFRSAPEQNAGGWPVMTMVRAASSELAAAMWSWSSVTRMLERALRRSGRLSVIQAAPFLTS